MPPAVPDRHAGSAGGLHPVHCRAAEDPHSADRSGQTTIPEKTDSQAVRLRKGSRDGRPCGFHENRYKKRNTAERAINRPKQSRAVATRDDERGYVFLGAATAASVAIWLRT
ncbi:hypothetical protein [Streptomyces sp. NPDC002122]|uniref:hypothetical protein n=1 Tax=Streptomyces sp. NPDC002122 TaxID=3154407 RepID=UPI0033188231